MARSLKKGPFVDHHLMAKVDKAAATKDKNASNAAALATQAPKAPVIAEVAEDKTES